MCVKVGHEFKKKKTKNNQAKRRNGKKQPGQCGSIN